MMKFKVKALFAAAMMCAIVAGCNENTVDPEDPVLAAPTNLMANSQSGAVTLKWTASTSTTSADFGDYQLTVTPAPATGGSTIIIPKASTMYKVEGLTNGTEYTFSLRSRGTTTTNLSGAQTIKWAPATRINGVRIYETASTTNGSGLNFSNPTTALFISQGNQWDIGLDTRDNSLDIGSPSKTSYIFKDAAGNMLTPKTTLVSFKRYEGVSSLDEVFDTDALGANAGMAPDSTRLINFNGVNQGFIFFAKTAEGNVAKILVKGTGSGILQGNTGNRYVEMDISYQTNANLPYAFVANGNTSKPAFKTVENSSAKKVSAE